MFSMGLLTFGLWSVLDTYAMAMLCVVKAHHKRANTSVIPDVMLLSRAPTVNFSFPIVFSNQQKDTGDWFNFTPRTSVFFDKV